MGYSIGEVTAQTGVKAVTLRAWESRYGLVHPERSASSYRRYSEHDVEVVRRMSLLIGTGLSAREAARTISTTPAEPVLPKGGTESVLTDTSAVARAGATLDGETLRRVLDEAFASASIEWVVDSWLMPSMREVGDRWADGSLDVVSEHVISATVMRKLSALFEITPAHGPRVVVGLPESCRHELPAMAFALLLQRAGACVLYAGSDVPVSDWAQVVGQWHPVAAVTGATRAGDAPLASAAVGALTRNGVAPVFVGGNAADQVDGAMALPRSLAAAAKGVVVALGKGR